MSSEARENRSPTSSTVPLTNTAEDEESELTEEEEGQDSLDADAEIGEGEKEEKERSDEESDLDSDEGEEDERETPVQHPRKRCVPLHRIRDNNADDEQGLLISSHTP